MVTPNQMLFLRGSIGPIPAIYERRSTLSHSYKITTSFTSYVHEQIFIVRPLSPGGVIAYVPEFCRVVVDKSCRFLPLIWGLVGKGIAEPPPPSFSSGWEFSFIVSIAYYDGPLLSPPYHSYPESAGFMYVY